MEPRIYTGTARTHLHRCTLVYAVDDALSQPPIFEYLAMHPSNPSGGQTAMVDDVDSLVKYSGSWSTELPVPTAFGYSTCIYLNTAL
jgi:hypothetical protein